MTTAPRDVVERRSTSFEGVDPRFESHQPIPGVMESNRGFRSGPGYQGPVDPTQEAEEGRATGDAVVAALCWLARHQNEDGSWSADHFDRHCPLSRRCGGTGGARCDDCVTALAVLAFLGADRELTLKGVFVDPAHPDRQISVLDVTTRGRNWIAARRCYPRCQGALSLSDQIDSGTWTNPLFPAPKGRRPQLESLTSSQLRSGCGDGSWDSGAPVRGRITVTALHALQLEGHPDPAGLLGTCQGGYR